MRCCCGCPSTVTCSECSGNPDKGLFVVSSGIVPAASGTCFNASGGASPARFDYTSVQDYSSCVVQDVNRPCGYGNFGSSSGSLFDPLATNRQPLSGTCPLSTASPISMNFVLAYLLLSGGVYTLNLYAGSLLFFQGTQTVSSPPCRLASPLTFTNSITVGNVYTFATFGGLPAGFTTGFAFASGGSCTVMFKKSCCPAG